MSQPGRSAHAAARRWIGRIGETGELALLLRYAVAAGARFDQDRIADEAGDTFWYLAALCTKSDIPLSDVMERNIAKLKRRFPDGWSTERSINREEVTP